MAVPSTAPALDPDPASSPALAALQSLPGSTGTADPIGLALEVGVFVLLLALSALFSGSEVALFSISAGEKEAIREAGTAPGRRVLRLLDRPRRLLVAILLLNTVVNVGAAILSTQIVLALAAAQAWSEVAVLAVNVVVLTFILLVTSEIAPKLIASRQPVRFAERVAPFLTPLVRVLAPVADALATLASAIRARLRTTDDPLSSDDIKSMADVGEAQGSIEERERALIHSIVEFGETTVREVMVSRVDLTAIPETATLAESLAVIRESGHSRFPLYRDNLDQVLGVVYAKDLLPYLGTPEAEPAADGGGFVPDWEAIARRPPFVPHSKPLDDMLADFQRTSTHLAIVVDEYGGTAGLVTLEDLLEEVVGEIRDELDDAADEEYVTETAPGVWACEARVDLDDLADAVGVALDTDAFDFETLGGLVLDLAGDIPAPGDEFTFERLHLRVEGMDENRVTRVAVTVLPEHEAADEV